MDELRKLIENRNYDLVIEKTKNSSTYKELFYLISALLAKGNVQESIKIIEKNQKELEKNLPILIPLHIEILCLIKDFPKAKKTLDYYNLLPYHSQVVEEILIKSKNKIENEEKNLHLNNSLSEEEIKTKLKSQKSSEIIYALENLKDKDVLMYLNEIKAFLKSDNKESLKSLALILLVQKEIDREIEIKKENKIIKVNPKKLKPPFDEIKFPHLLKEMSMRFKDPSLFETAKQIISSYIIYFYPNIISVGEEELILSLYFLSKEMLGENTDIIKKETFDNKKVDLAQVEKLILEMKKCLKEL